MKENLKRKKIALLTFHDSLSYGAILQCYSLYKTIVNLGYEIDVIDFIRDNKVKIKSLKTLLIYFVMIFRGFVFYKKQKILKNKFYEFKNSRMSFTEKKYTSINDMMNLVAKYSTIIVGSDQVWNPSNPHLEVYGLGYFPDNIKTIAYAPSIGSEELSSEHERKLYQAINKIKYLSCREKSGCELLNRLLNKEVLHVLDPTLLLDNTEWEKVMSPVNGVTKNQYVLCYFLGSMKYQRTYAKYISQKLSLPIVYIWGSPMEDYKSNVITDCSPEEFVWLFRHAAFICTDSFHGVSFSINFKKNFFAFKRRGYNSKQSYVTRISSILELLNLSDRYLDWDTLIDRCEINTVYDNYDRLKDMKRVSMEYLDTSIRE